MSWSTNRLILYNTNCNLLYSHYSTITFALLFFVRKKINFTQNIIAFVLILRHNSNIYLLQPINGSKFQKLKITKLFLICEIIIWVTYQEKKNTFFTQIFFNDCLVYWVNFISLYSIPFVQMLPNNLFLLYIIKILKLSHPCNSYNRNLKVVWKLSPKKKKLCDRCSVSVLCMLNYCIKSL